MSEITAEDFKKAAALCSESYSATPAMDSENEKKEDDMASAPDFDSVPSVDSEGPQRSVEGYIVFVGNLNEETVEEDVRDVFSEFGPIKNLQMNIDRKTGFMKGYALIEYANLSEAQDAVKYGNGKKLHDHDLLVDFAFKKPPSQNKK